jgi:AcrR family transcriptional regulator
VTTPTSPTSPVIAGPPGDAPGGRGRAEDSRPGEDAGGVPARRGRPRDERATRAIVDAALRQVAAVGYARVSMDSIAAEAGVSRATIYRRYRDKADLITAAIAANAGGRLPIQPSQAPRADLVRYLRDFDARFDERFAEVIGTLLGSADEGAALTLHRQRVIEPRKRYLRSLLERGQELGQLRGDLDVDLAVHMLAGSIFARRLSGVPSAPGWAERAVDMIWPDAEPASTS